MDSQKCDCCVSCVSSAVKGTDKPNAVVYVPSHLYHMVFELIKVLYFSSLTAEILKYALIWRENLPKVLSRVLILSFRSRMMLSHDVQ